MNEVYLEKEKFKPGFYSNISVTESEYAMINQMMQDQATDIRFLLMFHSNISLTKKLRTSVIK